MTTDEPSTCVWSNDDERHIIEGLIKIARQGTGHTSFRKPHWNQLAKELNSLPHKGADKTGTKVKNQWDKVMLNAFVCLDRLLVLTLTLVEGIPSSRSEDEEQVWMGVERRDWFIRRSRGDFHRGLRCELYCMRVLPSVS